MPESGGLYRKSHGTSERIAHIGLDWRSYGYTLVGWGIERKTYRTAEGLTARLRREFPEAEAPPLDWLHVYVHVAQGE